MQALTSLRTWFRALRFDTCTRGALRGMRNTAGSGTPPPDGRAPSTPRSSNALVSFSSFGRCGRQATVAGLASRARCSLGHGVRAAEVPAV